MSLKVSEISLDAFNDYLSQYSTHIPAKLEELEDHRMIYLPRTIQTRKNSKKPTHINKDELTKLVEWKLKHGTFRPKLLQLVTSNSEEDIRKATTSGFKKYESNKDAYEAASAITTLKGIGIATASLVMATYDPENIGFFGDEVFRWLMWDEATTKPGRGWDRIIAYNTKEYRRYADILEDVIQRLGVEAVDVEKVGYVLGKLKADIGGTKGDSEDKKNEDKKDKLDKTEKKRALDDEQESPGPSRKKGTPVPTGEEVKKQQSRGSTRSLRSGG